LGVKYLKTFFLMHSKFHLVYDKIYWNYSQKLYVNKLYLFKLLKEKSQYNAIWKEWIYLNNETTIQRILLTYRLTFS